MTANGGDKVDRLIFVVVLGIVNGIVTALAPLLGKAGVDLAAGGFAAGVAGLTALILGPTLKSWLEKRKRRAASRQ